MQSSRTAITYDRNRFHPLIVSGQIAASIEHALSKREAHLLEVGIGTGRIAMPLIARGLRYTGLDLSVEMLNVCRAKCNGISNRVSLVEGDAQDLPFDPESFDALIAVHVWHLIPNLELALSQAIRVLKPDGLIFEGWEAQTEDSPELELQHRWIAAVAALGYQVTRGGHRAALENSQRFLAQHAQGSNETVIANWTLERSIQEVLESLEEGVFSFARRVPEQLRYRAASAVRNDLERQDLDLNTPIHSNWAFHLRTTQIQKTANQIMVERFTRTGAGG